MLTRLPATELATRLQCKSLSAEELMAATLDQIAAANGALNAVVALRATDELMAEAKAMDQGPVLGPLHGIPIAVKDLVNVAGMPATMGSPAFANNIPEQDDILATRMRAAGAILIGKTNVPEFGLGSHTFNPVYGATRNPYAQDLTCGGSSGGAAVALATGMLALADGSDMMGSLRNPAAWNNVYGFRPSWGVVPSEPAPNGDTFLNQLSTLGPMARNPADIGLFLDVMSGPDPRQPGGAPIGPVAPVTPADLRGLRIGWLGNWGGAVPMEDGLMTLCQTACAVFEDLGATVDEVPPPFEGEAIFQSWQTLRSWTVAAGLRPLRDAGATLKDTALWEISQGENLTALEVHKASAVRSEWYKTFAQISETYDAFIMPVTQVWPFSVKQDYPKEIAGVAMDTYHRWMEIVVPVSLLGLPSLAVPAGFGASGLPGGIQLFGPRGSDARMLQIGAAYHAATQWPDQRPPER